MTERIKVAGWYGISINGIPSGHIAARPTTTNYGWREAEWERDPVLGWIERRGATMRYIVGYRIDELGEWHPILGEPIPQPDIRDIVAQKTKL